MVAPPPRRTLAANLDAESVHQRQRALIHLLRHPLLVPHGPHAEAFLLVRRHAAMLREWLSRYPGWSLRVDSRCIRLRKAAAVRPGAARPATDPRSGQAFTRRRYALLCLGLCALEHADHQTTLGQIANRILTFVAHDPAMEGSGMTFDLQTRDQREDLVQALTLLVHLGVLTRIDGNEQQYVTDGGHDVLYNIDRDAAAAMLSVQQGPSLVQAAGLGARLEAISAVPLPSSDEVRIQRCRQNIYRRLLDHPVLYYDELPADELEYLTHQRPHILGVLHEATGLTAEVRAEGIALVDETGVASDVSLPEEGTDGHVALLVAEFLGAHLKRHGAAAVSEAALQAHMLGLMQEHRTHWRKDATAPGAEVTLVEESLDLLAALDLVKRTADGAVPRPAIARYVLAGFVTGNGDGDAADSHAALADPVAARRTGHSKGGQLRW